ncbi:uncharacterized protein LOC130248340 [Oenanthe melanoleuca]|uniref:uncharacterized protein LOC130248340 n=1 Tax=Oenanthe melanoleuca TaxID=2939378 RepID=UPI0024C1FF9A|nr:uncharacterized protein LOC130248340 [Oenanthe melanoleuca]
MAGSDAHRNPWPGPSGTSGPAPQEPPARPLREPPARPLREPPARPLREPPARPLRSLRPVPSGNLRPVPSRNPWPGPSGTSGPVPALHGASGPAVPWAPSAGERPARSPIAAETIGPSLLHSLTQSFPSHGTVTALRKFCATAGQQQLSIAPVIPRSIQWLLLLFITWMMKNHSRSQEVRFHASPQSYIHYQATINLK